MAEIIIVVTDRDTDTVEVREVYTSTRSANDRIWRLILEANEDFVCEDATHHDSPANVGEWNIFYKESATRINIKAITVD